MKNEQDLIKLREKRRKKLAVWRPVKFWPLASDIWKTVLLRVKDDKLREKAFTDIQLLQKNAKDTKYFEGQNYLFAEFVGKPREHSLIIIYTEDILVANFFQADLFWSHLYFILEHELKHYLGATHEDMDEIKEFNYA